MASAPNQIIKLIQFHKANWYIGLYHAMVARMMNLENNSRFLSVAEEIQ